MTEPLSRFASQDPKPRPSHTVVVPFRATVDKVVKSLLDEGEIFTVEPSPNRLDVWHIGIFETGVEAVTEAVRRR